MVSSQVVKNVIHFHNDTRYYSITLNMLVVGYILSVLCCVTQSTVILFITQRFEKLCRAILASMEVENEPKVSVHVFIL